MSEAKNESILSNIYYNANNPAAFSTSSRIFTYLKNKGIDMKKQDIINWLQKQNTHTLHRDRRIRFERRKYNITNIDDLWEMDLMDMQAISRKNGGNKYILAVIDCFSKYAWCIPIKRKTPSEVLKAIDILFSSTERRPITIQSDKGREFDNKVVRKYFTEMEISYKTTKDPVTKASICERFIRTIKSIIFKYFTYTNTNRYVDVLSSLLYVYNNRTHSTIGMPPSQVNEKNILKVWTYMNKRKIKSSFNYCTPKYCDGDIVRISNSKKVFDKGYKPKWSNEIFTVEKCILTKPISYRLKDSNDIPINGDFYESELQKIVK